MHDGTLTQKELVHEWIGPLLNLARYGKLWALKQVHAGICWRWVQVHDGTWMQRTQVYCGNEQGLVVHDGTWMQKDPVYEWIGPLLELVH